MKISQIKISPNASSGKIRFIFVNYDGFPRYLLQPCSISHLQQKYVSFTDSIGLRHPNSCHLSNYAWTIRRCSCGLRRADADTSRLLSSRSHRDTFPSLFSIMPRLLDTLKRYQLPFASRWSLYSILLLGLPFVALSDFLFKQLEPLLGNSRLLSDIAPLITHLHLKLSKTASAVPRKSRLHAGERQEQCGSVTDIGHH